MPRRQHSTSLRRQALPPQRRSHGTIAAFPAIFGISGLSPAAAISTQRLPISTHASAPPTVGPILWITQTPAQARWEGDLGGQTRLTVTAVEAAAAVAKAWERVI